MATSEDRELVPYSTADYQTLPDGSICPSSLLDERYTRLSGKLDVKTGDQRTPTEKDKARVAYSLYTQRLAGVTQVVTPDEFSGDLHSRQSHSAKVALVSGDIARDLARRAITNEELRRKLLLLGGLDIGACEAAGLAHDIGHPPFGHVAEKLLDQFLTGTGNFPFIETHSTGETMPLSPVNHFLGPEEPATHDDGFEGNAQSFRAVTFLDSNKDLGSETKEAERRSPTGIDLTSVTLAAILKYPWWRVKSVEKFDTKFGSYSSEISAYAHAREWTLKTAVGRYNQTVEASIMDLADDLTYAVHDLQDFYIAGRLNIKRIVEELDSQAKSMALSGYFDFASATEDQRESHLKSERREGIGERNPFEAAYRSLAVYYSGFLNRDSYILALQYAVEKLRSLDDQFTGSPNAVGKVIKTFSDILGEAIPTTDVYADPPWLNGPYVNISASQWHNVQVLKHISKSFIIRSEFVGFTQRSQTASLTRVLHGFDEWLQSEPRFGELPQPLRGYLQAKDDNPGKLAYNNLLCRRAVVDHLCAKTDRQVMELSRWFAGIESPRFVPTS